MAIGNRGIGWTQEENLLWEVSRQLDRTISFLCTGPCPPTTTTTSSTSTTTTTTTANPCPNCVQAPVVIGAQIWDKCNLNVTTYRNGDVIPQVTDPAAWAALTTGAWCHYDNNPANDVVYGKLYNWFAVNDPRGLAPVGKKVPTDTDWTILTDLYGGPDVAGGAMKDVGLCYWQDPNTGATNISGFSGLPAAYRRNNGTFFLSVGYNGYWWSSTEYDTTDAWAYNLYYYTGFAYRANSNKNFGFSIRCLIE